MFSVVVRRWVNTFDTAEMQVSVLTTCLSSVIVPVLYYIIFYGDGLDNTTEDNSCVFSLIRTN